MRDNKNSAAKIAANNRYNAKAYDRTTLTLPKGKLDQVKAYAQERGESVNAYVNRLIQEDMQK